MRDKEFSLLEEPWIRVLLPECSVREVSLTDALVNAHRYRELAGEMSTQDMTVLRLLLAVLYAVFTRVDETGENAPLQTADDALDRWEALWNAGRLPEKPIRDYLTRWSERFWLFHPERPFYQVPQAAAGTGYGAKKLNGEIAESENKARLFNLYAGEFKESLTYGQAARWLLNANGFDDASAKSKGKGLPSVGAGWLGKIGPICNRGMDLRETLLLNLVLLREDGSLWGPEQPCWELDTPRADERTEIALPDNQSALLTLQSRRLLLHRQGKRVDGFSLLGGDFFSRENAFPEQMTVWKQAQEKKNAPVVYLPRRHDPARQFWREFPSVFAGQGGDRVPGVVHWYARLQRLGLIDRKRAAVFAVAGIAYDDKNSSIKDSYSDTLTFHAALLGEMNGRQRGDVTDEIGRIEKLAKLVGGLAQDLELAAGKEPKAGAAAKESFYARIDQPFRRWLAAADPDGTLDDWKESLLGWHDQALCAARALGRELVDQAGPSAFAGREVEQKNRAGKQKIRYSAPKAYDRFLLKTKQVYL